MFQSSTTRGLERRVDRLEAELDWLRTAHVHLRDSITEALAPVLPPAPAARGELEELRTRLGSLNRGEVHRNHRNLLLLRATPPAQVMITGLVRARPARPHSVTISHVTKYPANATRVASRSAMTEKGGSVGMLAGEKRRLERYRSIRSNKQRRTGWAMVTDGHHPWSVRGRGGVVTAIGQGYPQPLPSCVSERDAHHRRGASRPAARSLRSLPSPMLQRLCDRPSHPPLMWSCAR
jgi:hypothetical protein